MCSRPTLDHYDNCDPRTLTVLVIGTAANVNQYILAQRRSTEVTAWSRLQPVPNCPGKFMTLLDRLMVDPGE